MSKASQSAGQVVDGRKSTGDDCYLYALQVTRIQVHGYFQRMNVDLVASGSREALEVVQAFANACWLDDPEVPYLDSLLRLPEHGCGHVNLREDGGAAWEESGQCVRVYAMWGEPFALVAWEEFRQAMRLKHYFRYLMRHYKGQGVPGYSAEEGFRVRLHAQG